jgi:fucose 4-O-acetylase-like acetyltransferase
MSSLPQPPSTTSRSDGGRFAAIDIARALAVVGVVANHSVDGLIAADLMSDDGIIAEVNRALYIFRMPALAFLLGLFIPRGIEKRGTARYLKNRVIQVMWVWILWTLIQGGTQVLVSPVTNAPMSLVDVVSIWNPIAQFWFLPFLIVSTAIVTLLRPWSTSAGAVWKVAIVLVPSVLLWAATPNVAGVRGLGLLAFVALGAVVGTRTLGKTLQRQPIMWAVSGCAGATILVVAGGLGALPATLPAYPAVTVQLISLIGAAGGTVALLGVSSLLSRIRGISAALASIGTQTMAIYLMHVLIVAGARVAFARLGLPGSAIVCVAVMLGVAVPYLAGRYAERLHIGWLFRPPHRLESAVGPTSQRRVASRQ